MNYSMQMWRNAMIEGGVLSISFSGVVNKNVEWKATFSDGTYATGETEDEAVENLFMLVKGGE